jgi:hypoxanthine-DNA glycosylase
LATNTPDRTIPDGQRHSAFAPAVADDARVLILGSLPGAASLAAAQYYAHPQNRFWQLVGAVIAREDLADMAYPDRLVVLRAAHVGLWDTIASAERRGSLDAAIRAPDPAPLTDLVARLPHLRAIGFNGAKSAAIGRRQLAGTTLALIDLPSSSPAHAGMPLAEKRARWLALARHLG